MSTLQVESRAMDGPIPAPQGSDALQVLLVRGDLGSADRVALLRTCKAFARLVLSYSLTTNLTLHRRHRRNSPFTAQLLADATCSTGADSKASGTDVHLTLSGCFSHSLPKASISVLNLFRVGLPIKQWHTLLSQLSSYTRLHTLRLHECSCSGSKSPLTIDKRSSTIRHLHLFCDSKAARRFEPALGLLAGFLGPQANSLSAPGGTLHRWTEGNVPSFIKGLQSVHLLLDDSLAVIRSPPLLTLLRSLKHVELHFATMFNPRDINLCTSLVRKGPPTCWESFTLTGYVPYDFIAMWPLHPSTKVTVVGDLVAYGKAPSTSPPASTPIFTHRHLTFRPVQTAVRAPGCGERKTVHLYTPSAPVLELVLPRLSPDVDCLALWGRDHRPLLSTEALSVLSNTLPPHVTCVVIKLDSTARPARILPHPLMALVEDLVPDGMQPVLYDLLDVMYEVQMQAQQQLLPDTAAYVQQAVNHLQGQPQPLPPHTQLLYETLQMVLQTLQQQQPGEAAAAAAEPQLGQDEAGEEQEGEEQPALQLPQPPAQPHQPQPQLELGDAAGAAGAAVADQPAPPAAAAAPPQPQLQPPAGIPQAQPQPQPQPQLPAAIALNVEAVLDIDDQEEIDFVPRVFVLPKLPSHVTTLCVEAINTWAPGVPRAKQWAILMSQLAVQYTSPHPIKLVLTNLAPGKGVQGQKRCSWTKAEIKGFGEMCEAFELVNIDLCLV